MALSGAADDLEIIRSRMEELRLERDRALVGQKMGSRVDGTASEDNWNDERRLLRSVLLRSSSAEGTERRHHFHFKAGAGIRRTALTC